MPIADHVTDELVAELTTVVGAAIGRPVLLDAGWRPPVQGAVGHLLGLRHEKLDHDAGSGGGSAAEGSDGALVAKLFAPDAALRAATEAGALRAATVLGGLAPRVVAEGRLTGGVGFLAMTRLPGRRWADERPGLTPSHSAAVVAEVGRVARRLHAVTGDRFGALPVEGDGWPTLSSWTAALVARTLATFREAGGDPALAVGVERLAAATVLDDAMPSSFCHQDLNGGNVLLRPDPDGPPVVSGVVDFERAEWADPMHDLALTVVHFMHEREDALIPVLLEAHGGVDDAARRRLVLHVVLRMAAEWAWVAADRPADWRPKTVALAAWIRDRV